MHVEPTVQRTLMASYAASEMLNHTRRDHGHGRICHVTPIEADVSPSILIADDDHRSVIVAWVNASGCVVSGDVCAGSCSSTASEGASSMHRLPLHSVLPRSFSWVKCTHTHHE